VAYSLKDDDNDDNITISVVSPWKRFFLEATFQSDSLEIFRLCGGIQKFITVFKRARQPYYFTFK
jgi:hypothetical protein